MATIVPRYNTQKETSEVAIIAVERAPSGSILRLTETNSRKENLQFLVLCSILLLVLIYGIFYASGPLPRSQVLNGVGALGFLVLCFIFARRLLMADAGLREFANVSGLSMFRYQELGFIPWSEVESFDIIPDRTPLSGGSVLIAQFKNPSQLLARLKPSNRYLPSKRYAVPFGCIDVARSTDLQFLKEVLIELRRTAKGTTAR